jgi:hypothetical protein
MVPQTNQGPQMTRVHAMGVLPHEQLEKQIDNACASSISYLEAEQRLQDAYMDFDMNSSQENASGILSALTNLAVERSKISYAIVHEKDLTPASTFIGQVRHT